MIWCNCWCISWIWTILVIACDICWLPLIIPSYAWCQILLLILYDLINFLLLLLLILILLLITSVTILWLFLIILAHYILTILISWILCLLISEKPSSYSLKAKLLLAINALVILIVCIIFYVRILLILLFISDSRTSFHVYYSTYTLWQRITMLGIHIILIKILIIRYFGILAWFI